MLRFYLLLQETQTDPGALSLVTPAKPIPIQTVDNNRHITLTPQTIGSPVFTPSAPTPSPGAFSLTHAPSMRNSELHISYLKQAFCRFVRARESVEMQHLGRVMCAILNLSAEEQALAMDAINKLAPNIVVNATLENISSISSYFGLS